MWIRCVMSAELDESCKDLYECEVAVEIIEMAESIDDVRGIDRDVARIVVSVEGDDVLDEEERGGESCKDWD